MNEPELRTDETRAAYKRGFAAGHKTGRDDAPKEFPQESQQARQDREAEIRRQAYSDGEAQGRIRGYRQAKVEAELEAELEDELPHRGRLEALTDTMSALAAALKQQGTTNEWLAATVRQQGHTIRELAKRPPIAREPAEPILPADYLSHEMSELAEREGRPVYHLIPCRDHAGSDQQV